MSKSNLFLLSSEDSFWESIGVSPTSVKMTQKKKSQEIEEYLLKFLRKLGVSNIRLLCEKAGINDPGPLQRASLPCDLLKTCDRNTLLYLKEFSKNRLPEIEEAFKKASDVKPTALEGDFSRMARKNERIKAFTRLLLLYHKDPRHLGEIYFMSVWRSRATGFEYGTSDEVPKKLESLLRSKLAGLAKVISKANSDREVKPIGVHQFQNGLVVAAFDREYTPVVKRDFREKFKVFHECGTIVFGIDPQRGTLDVRVRSQDIASAVTAWLKSNCDLDFTRPDDPPLKNFDDEKAKQALFAEPGSNPGMAVVSIRFRRSALPTHPTITIASRRDGLPLRLDIEALRTKEVLHADSLMDVEAMSVHFEDATAEVAFDAQASGILKLQFNNMGWPDEKAQKFRDLFQKNFHLPLNRDLDTTGLQSGFLAVVKYLLTVTDVESVQMFQVNIFDELKKKNYLTQTPVIERMCVSTTCKRKGKVVKDPNTLDCACGKPLAKRDRRQVAVNLDKAHDVAADIFKKATGRTLGTREKQFEKIEFFPLKAGKDNEQKMEICVFLGVNPPSKETLERMSRSARPVIVIQARADDNVFIDLHGRGVISLAYLIAATEESTLRAECEKRIQVLIDDLLRATAKRIHDAGDHSFRLLRDKPVGWTGNEYETDVFNVVHVLFPEAFVLGRKGKEEPDGFCAFVQYVEESRRDAHTWCWTYDAKYTTKDEGYELDVTERDKMRRYIVRFRENPKLFTKPHQVKAHIIISNNMTEEKIKAAYDLLMDKAAGLKGDHRSVKLVLMREEFVTELFDVAQKNHVEITRRPAVLDKFLIERIEATTTYLILDKTDAKEIMGKVLKEHPRVYNPPAEDALKVK